MKSLLLAAALLFGTSALADHHEGEKGHKKIATKGGVSCDKLKTDEEKKMCNEKMNKKADKKAEDPHDHAHGDEGHEHH